MYRYNARPDSSDSHFEGPPVAKKPLIEISDEELSSTSEVHMSCDGQELLTDVCM